MIPLIRGEAIKLRSTRTALGFLIAGVALTLLVVLVSTLAGDPSTVEDKRAAMSVGVLFILFVVYGVVGATGEYRHRTVAPAVLIAPDRLRLLLARTLAYTVTAMGFAALMLVVALAIGIPLMAGNDGPSLALSDYLGLVGGTLLAAGLGGAMGVGIGALVGNQVAGVIGVLVYIFVIDGLIGLAKHSLTPYTIGSAAPKLTGDRVNDAFAFPGALAVLAGWTLLFVAAGMWRERRREVT